MVRTARFLLPAFLIALSACVTETPEGPTPAEDCIPTETYFQDDVWNAFMSQNCYACHNAQGVARETEFVLQSQNQPGHLLHNLGVVENIAELERNGVSILLLKPSKQVDHGGGQAIEQDGPEYKALEGLISRFQDPVACEVVDTGEFFNGVELLDEPSTIRKAAVALVGRLPTDDEIAQVEGGDADDLDAVLDSMLDEEAFYTRLKENYNDLFLTDRYVGQTRAIDLLNMTDYPDAYWFEDLDENQYSAEYIDNANRYTNDSVAKEPLELIAHIVRNDLPFTEVVTADYIMVNGYSSQVYGVTDVEFTNPADPTEFHPGHIDGFPHAGVLSSAMWLNRFPTTATNRNRHRARMVYDFFLDTDIMRLAERPVDPTSIVDFNPTMYNPSCTVCHANMDPVAGAFQNFDATGRYAPPEEGWFPDMRPAGYKTDVIPSTDWGNSLQWLGEKISGDPLFALSAVHATYRALTGQEALNPPNPESMDEATFKAMNRAYQQQERDLQAVATEFAASGYNLKVAIKGVVKTPWFRARAADDVEGERAIELADLGTARFLTPELLHRKIEAVTGFPWASRTDANRNYLLRSDEFLIFYGGIDSNAVTERITNPNGLMSSIAIRMANEMSCRAGPRDFNNPTENRILFPHVERTFEPMDSNGFEVAGAVEAIKKNIQHLHARVLGERLSLNDPELERTYGLFLATWQEGKAKRLDNTVARDLDGECRSTTYLGTTDPLPEEFQVSNDDNYVVRSWMAVLTYLMSDYRFLHE